tara:strand:- start:1068 stop:1562 length:495 start_codon:yes stop_codon:yes gene_type:complete
MFKHKSSFNDFKVIKETENEQIFYYETNVFNFIPFSPIRRFISIKKLIPNEKKFKQIYLDIKSKKKFYFKCYMKNVEDEVTIYNEVVLQVSNLMYFFKKPLLWMINKKFDVMWKEDKEMLTQLYLEDNYQDLKCVPPQFNLDSLFNRDFENKFEKTKINLKVKI